MHEEAEFFRRSSFFMLLWWSHGLDGETFLMVIVFVQYTNPGTLCKIITLRLHHAITVEQTK